MTNPKAFLSVTERITSMALNLEAGFFIVYMLIAGMQNNKEKQNQKQKTNQNKTKSKTKPNKTKQNKIARKLKDAGPVPWAVPEIVWKARHLVIAFFAFAVLYDFVSWITNLADFPYL